MFPHSHRPSIYRICNITYNVVWPQQIINCLAMNQRHVSPLYNNNYYFRWHHVAGLLRYTSCNSPHSFIHSGYFYSASFNPLLLRGAPDCSIDTVSELTRRNATCIYEWRACPRSFLTWRLQWDSNLRPSGRTALNHPSSNPSIHPPIHPSN